MGAIFSKSLCEFKKNFVARKSVWGSGVGGGTPDATCLYLIISCLNPPPPKKNWAAPPMLRACISLSHV